MKTPDKEQAEKLFGEVCHYLLKTNHASHFDYTQYGVVEDKKKGIHWAYTLNKLNFTSLPPKEAEKVAKVNMYMVDSESEYLDKLSPVFLSALMLGESDLSGEDLRKFRENLGMTQAQFAAWLGLNREKTISDYEHGRRSIPGWLVARINSERQK